MSWREAEAHAASGGASAAAVALREASALARGIGAALLVERIDGLARRLRIDVLPPVAQDTLVWRPPPTRQSTPRPTRSG